ncbi:MAG: chromosome partitioning protein [Paracoccus sp. (in: a-proteobacteria)]|uniref:chromosome partitioning protein n=1 Tax=Paracoccus sp. TaxID=267 RepID=UPI0039E5F9DD
MDRKTAVPGARTVSSSFIKREAARAAEDAEHAALIAKRFAILRTRILREMRSRKWRKLAVVPVTQGAGGTFVAVHLALALARQQHTGVLLADLDLALPSVARMLGIPGCDQLSEVVASGRKLTEIAQTIEELHNLSVVAPAQPEDAAAEILQDEGLAATIDAAAAILPDSTVMILDCGPLIGQDEALAALPLADAVLLVADGRRGTASDMVQVERLLEGMPPVMGVILNKSED